MLRLYDWLVASNMLESIQSIPNKTINATCKVLVSCFMSWNKRSQKCSIRTKSLFLSNVVHKCVYIPGSEHFSFVKIIHPPDRCGISRSWLNIMIITQVHLVRGTIFVHTVWNISGIFYFSSWNMRPTLYMLHLYFSSVQLGGCESQCYKIFRQSVLPCAGWCILVVVRRPTICASQTGHLASLQRSIVIAMFTSEMKEGQNSKGQPSSTHHYPPSPFNSSVALPSCQAQPRAHPHCWQSQETQITEPTDKARAWQRWPQPDQQIRYMTESSNHPWPLLPELPWGFVSGVHLGSPSVSHRLVANRN